MGGPFSAQGNTHKNKKYTILVRNPKRKRSSEDAFHLRDFSLFDICPSNKHCPSARCAYAANAMGKDLDIFAIGAVSLNHTYTH
jgi:hypothetical protein